MVRVVRKVKSRPLDTYTLVRVKIHMRIGCTIWRLRDSVHIYSPPVPTIYGIFLVATCGRQTIAHVRYLVAISSALDSTYMKERPSVFSRIIYRRFAFCKHTLNFSDIACLTRFEDRRIFGSHLIKSQPIPIAYIEIWRLYIPCSYSHLPSLGGKLRQI